MEGGRGLSAVISRARRHLGRSGEVVSPLAYLVLALLLFSQAWQDPAHQSIGVGGDSWQMMWILGWPAHALAGGHNPWLSTAINHPDGVNLMWTPTPIIQALLATPIMSVWG